MDSNIIFRKIHDPEVQAKCFVHSPDEQQEGYVRAFLVDKNGLKKDAVHEIKRIVHRKAEEELIIKTIVSSLDKEYRRKSGKAIDEIVKDGKLTTAYNNLEDKSILDGAWRESTARHIHAFFSRQVLPALDEAADEYGEIESGKMGEIANQLLNKSMSRKNSFKDAASINRFHAKLGLINDMIKRLYTNCFPSSQPPQFPCWEKYRVAKREQLKWLPEIVRQSLAIILLAAVLTEPFALACALMFCAGLRTSEAAAVYFHQIILHGTYATLYVEFQILDTGERVPVGKTDQAYRLVVLPWFFVVLYKKCVQALQKKGYSLDKIMHMPFCNLGGANSSKLSTYCERLLERAGLTKDDAEGILALMRQEPDLVDGKPVLDYTAYILRRDWATRAAACSMPQEMLDYMIGHRNKALPEKYYEKYLDNQKMDEASQINNRYIFHPDYALHPMYTPISLDGDSCLDIELLPGYNAFRIQNVGNSPLSISIDINSAEPGDALVVKSPRGAIRKNGASSTKCLDDPVNERIGRLVSFQQTPIEELK